MIRIRGAGAVVRGKNVLESINLEIRDGEWTALTGANGSGKSTLCRIAAGIQEPDSGSVEIDPSGTGGVPVAIAMQNPDSQFVTTTVKREILFGMQNISLPEKQKTERLEESVELFELGSLLERNPHTLSGGEKQRLLLASVWVMNPRHLILDEPLTFLDRSSGELVTEAVREHFFDRGRSVLWAALESFEIEQAQRVLYLEGRRLREYSSPDEFLEAEPDAAVSGGEESIHVVSGGTPAVDGGSEKVVQVRGLGFSYPESGFSLRVEGLTVRRGESVGLSGPVGCGKSTLLSVCAGLLPPGSGTVRVFGKVTESVKDFQAQRVAVLFQMPEQGFFAETVQEEVALGYRSFHGDPGWEDAVRKAMETAGIDYGRFRRRDPYTLSQGEKRLCALASVIVLDAELYILDEPSLFLDVAARENLKGAIRKLTGPDTAIIMASHDIPFMREMTDRIIELPGGISDSNPIDN